MSIVRSAVLWLTALIGLACIVLFAAAMLFGIRPQVVVSGSMEPHIPTGALILTADAPGDDLRVGDVVTVPRRDGDGSVTHRIVEIEKTPAAHRLTLQGDANAAPDATTYEVRHAGRVVATVPYVGYLAAMLRTPFGIAGVVLFAGAIVALFAAGPRRPRRPRAALNATQR